MPEVAGSASPEGRSTSGMLEVMDSTPEDRSAAGVRDAPPDALLGSDTPAAEAITPLSVLALDSSDRLESDIGLFEVDLMLRDRFNAVVSDTSARMEISSSCTISFLPVCFFDILVELLSPILKTPIKCFRIITQQKWYLLNIDIVALTKMMRCTARS